MVSNSRDIAVAARGPGMDVASITIPRPASLYPPADIERWQSCRFQRRGNVGGGPGSMAYARKRPHAARAGGATVARHTESGDGGWQGIGARPGAVNAKAGASGGKDFSGQLGYFRGTGRGRVAGKYCRS